MCKHLEIRLRKEWKVWIMCQIYCWLSSFSSSVEIEFPFLEILQIERMNWHTMLLFKLCCYQQSERATCYSSSKVHVRFLYGGGRKTFFPPVLLSLMHFLLIIQWQYTARFLLSSSNWSFSRQSQSARRLVTCDSQQRQQMSRYSMSSREKYWNHR